MNPDSYCISYGNSTLYSPREIAEDMRGWKNLVLGLIKDLFKLGWDGHLLQIKEKYGGLRFYIGQGTDEMLDRIEKAERDSCDICEVCGKPGIPRDRAWIKTLCDDHAY